MSKSKKQSLIQNKETIDSQIEKTPSFWWIKFIPFLLGVTIYVNTLGHDYTQDDAIVIYENMFTQKGVSGISGLLTEDTFFGFFKERGKEKLVSGGRYRPFTPIMFAVEYQLFGKNPFIGHLINCILYGLLGLLIFQVLSMIFAFRNDYKEKFVWIILSMVCLYVSHPIHTEAVANIKGRDEIMSMMGSVATLYFILKNEIKKQRINIIMSFVSFFIALMSKENAITYLAIIPLVLIMFYNKSFTKSLFIISPLLAAALIFIIIRTAVLGFDLGSTSMELMNNPFIKLQGDRYIPYTFGEKTATIFYIQLKYLGLIFFPHPLTHDYYPMQIPMMSFSDTKVLFSLLFYALMAFGVYYFYKKDKVISFTLLYYFITLSIVSNVFVNIGTNMNERFMFMPSLAFCMLIPYLVYKYSGSKNLTLGIMTLVILAFSYKTIDRNKVWKNDFTLFTTDVKTSMKSAKVLNAAGGALVTESEKNKEKRKEYCNQAVNYLTQAIKIHPNYKNAYLLLGNAQYYLDNLDNAIMNYEQCLKLDPNFKDAKNNLAVVYRDRGRSYGEKHNDLINAEKYLLKAYEINPDDAETNRLLGIAKGMAGKHIESIKYFEKVTKLSPNEAGGYMNLSTAYAYLKDEVNSQKYREIALSLDPSLGKK
jgi:tetratricopeptide (TPR) repeat protein